MTHLRHQGTADIPKREHNENLKRVLWRSLTSRLIEKIWNRRRDITRRSTDSPIPRIYQSRRDARSSSGNTNSDSNGDSGNGSNGNSGDGSNGNSGDGSNRNSGDGSNGNSGDGSNGNSGDGSNGNSGDVSNGNSGNGSKNGPPGVAGNAQAVESSQGNGPPPPPPPPPPSSAPAPPPAAPVFNMGRLSASKPQTSSSSTTSKSVTISAPPTTVTGTLTGPYAESSPLSDYYLSDNDTGYLSSIRTPSASPLWTSSSIRTPHSTMLTSSTYVSATAVPSNVATLDSNPSSPARKAEIASGTVGALILIIALLLLLFFWRRKGIPRAFSSCLKCRQREFQASKQPFSISQPLKIGQTGITTGDWHYEASFAKPWTQPPRTLHTSLSRSRSHPLALNPITPPTTPSTVATRRSFFRSSNRSFPSIPSPLSAQSCASTDARPSRVLGHQYTRLPSPMPSIADSRALQTDIDCP